MKPNPFFSGFVCGVALTLAAVIALTVYHKPGPVIAAVPLAAAAPPPPPILSSPERGSKQAPVTLFDYSDFHCPYCRKAMPVIEKIIQNYPGKVRVIFKHSPLAETPGKGSFLTHEASVCAQEQGKFWEFAEAVYALSEPPDEAGVHQVAGRIGLNPHAFEACLKSDRPQKAIRADLEEGRAHGIQGTPTFVINGKQLAGVYPYEKFEQMIEEVLSPGKKIEPPAPAAPPQKAEFTDLAGRPSLGPEKARVTLVEFSDFHCPFCLKLEPTLARILQDYPGKIRRVWRHFPLAMHAGSERTHQASECAHAQGKFWAYHDKLFENFSAIKGEAFLNSLAAQTGLNLKKFKACMQDPVSKNAVQKDIERGRASGVGGTPAVFVNGRLISGAQPYENFKSVVDEELQKAGRPSKK